MKKKLLALVIALVVFALLGLLSTVIYLSVPALVIGGVMMALCMVMVFGMVWLLAYETLGGLEELLKW